MRKIGLGPDRYITVGCFVAAVLQCIKSLKFRGNSRTNELAQMNSNLRRAEFRKPVRIEDNMATNI
jgi:hypothetical protein